MDIRPKVLSMTHLNGYEEILEVVFVEKICYEIYDIGVIFINYMMDTVYSDGPVYFKSFPLSDSGKITVFTTFGNAVSPNESERGRIIFKDKLLIESEDFSSLSPKSLQTYYDYLSLKYSKDSLNKLAVYHVLYYDINGDLIVDVYSYLEGE